MYTLHCFCHDASKNEENKMRERRLSPVNDMGIQEFTIIEKNIYFLIILIRHFIITIKRLAFTTLSLDHFMKIPDNIYLESCAQSHNIYYL